MAKYQKGGDEVDLLFKIHFAWIHNIWSQLFGNFPETHVGLSACAESLLKLKVMKYQEL